MNKFSIDIFCEKFKDMKTVPIALYGTGLIAREIFEKCTDFNFTGVYDRERTSGEFCGYKILDIEQLGKSGISTIVIAAKRENVYTIYRRIYGVAQKEQIQLYNVWGEDLSYLYGEPIYKFQDENCYEDCKSALLKQVIEHEIISFDIFDTLIMRKVYEPHDVFMAVQKSLEADGILVENFYENRIKAEQNLLEEVPTLDELYIEFQRITRVPDEIREKLKKMEIDMEREAIVPRKDMVEIFQFAYEHEKQIFLVSDMYLPTPVLQDILLGCGVVGYQKLFNSCDYHKPKVNGLFEEYLNEVKGTSYLHIGDNKIADGTFAQNVGIDTYLIEKASTICELSFLGDMVGNIHTWNERVLYGLYISCLFNSPFCIDRCSKKVNVKKIDELAYCAVAPTVAAFIKWAVKLYRQTNLKILFSARDGWLVKKIVDSLETEIKNIYFYTSRIACLECRDSQEKRNNYAEYIRNQGVSNSERYLFFDLASSGTCLNELTSLFGLKLQGIFVYRYDCCNEKRKDLQILSLLQENPECAFWKHFKFFELILTSSEPSVSGFDKSGNPIFEQEYRNDLEKQYMQELQGGIEKYCKDFLTLSDESEINSDLLNGTIEVLDSGKCLIHDAKAEQLCIYDSYGVGKIKIFEEGKH